MSNKKKKKNKNSNYGYYRQKEQEWREAEEKREREANKPKNRILNILAFLLIAVSLVLAIYSSTHNLVTWAPFYTVTSAIAVMLIGYTAKDRRPNFYKVGMGMGVVLLVMAYFIGKQQGLF